MNSTIQNEDYSLYQLEADEYDHVEFVNCTFTDISNIDFNQCTFKNCNLSNSKLNITGLQSVTFTQCKLTGIDFSKIMSRPGTKLKPSNSML